MSSVNLAHIFGGLANRWPNRTAVVSPHLNLSYEQLVARASQSARELQSRGIGDGANVGICLRDGAETIVLMLAIWLARATVVIIDFRTNVEERNLLAMEFDMAAILEDRPGSGARYASIAVDSSWPDCLARHDRRPVWAGGDESAPPAVISLTSGTTGRPLGIILDHEKQLFQACFDLSQRFGEVFLNPLPLWFGASRNHVLGALLKGSTVYFHPPLFSAEELVEAVRASNATSVSAVPTIVRDLLDIASGRPKPLFGPLEALFCFGAPIFPDEKLKARELLCANFRDQYGSGICGRISAIWGRDLEQRPDTVGRPLPFVLLQIVDERDEVLPVGEPGVIRLRSPGVSSVIYGTSRTSGDSLKDGWAYPGDIGALDEEGFLRLLGRTSDRIIRGGVNVHPAEVEAVLAKCPGVEEVFVMGSAQWREGEEIVAFVVAAAGLREDDLVAYCRVWLSPDKRPRRFVFVSELPRTSKGEVSRSALRQQLSTV